MELKTYKLDTSKLDGGAWVPLRDPTTMLPNGADVLVRASYLSHDWREVRHKATTLIRSERARKRKAEVDAAANGDREDLPPLLPVEEGDVIRHPLVRQLIHDRYWLDWRGFTNDGLPVKLTAELKYAVCFDDAWTNLYASIAMAIQDTGSFLADQLDADLDPDPEAPGN